MCRGRRWWRRGRRGRASTTRSPPSLLLRAETNLIRTRRRLDSADALKTFREGVRGRDLGEAVRRRSEVAAGTRGKCTAGRGGGDARCRAAGDQGFWRATPPCFASTIVGNRGGEDSPVWACGIEFGIWQFVIHIFWKGRMGLDCILSIITEPSKNHKFPFIWNSYSVRSILVVAVSQIHMNLFSRVCSFVSGVCAFVSATTNMDLREYNIPLLRTNLKLLPEKEERKTLKS
jgi:hypothetical protein